VSLFSENSSRWMVVDQAIMMNGAADAVLPSSATQAGVIDKRHKLPLFRTTLDCWRLGGAGHTDSYKHMHGILEWFLLYGVLSSSGHCTGCTTGKDK
jgi:hypothetical protein